MTDYLQISEQAIDLDFNFANAQAADIAAYSVVVVDSANAISINNIVDGVAVKLSSTAGAVAIGVTMEILRGTTYTGGAWGVGRVRCVGPITKLICSAAITAGVAVQNDATGNGTVMTKAGGNAQIAIALTSTVNAGDELLGVLCAANNA